MSKPKAKTLKSELLQALDLLAWHQQCDIDLTHKDSGDVHALQSAKDDTLELIKRVKGEL